MSFETVLRRLFAAGRPWRIKKETVSNFIDALAEEYETLKTFYGQLIPESLPETSTDLLPEHGEALGLIFAPGTPVQEQRDRLFSRDTAIGSQDIVYLQEQLDRAGFNVTLQEFDLSLDDRVGIGEVGGATVGPSVTLVESPHSAQVGGAIVGLAELNTSEILTGFEFLYAVVGSVSSPEEFTRLQDELTYYVATHLHRVLFITGLETFGETGIGEVGAAIVGNGA